MAEAYNTLRVIFHALEYDMHEWTKTEAISFLVDLVYSKEEASVRTFSQFGHGDR